MTNTVNLNGTDYRIKRHATYGRYVNVKIEDVTPGMALDQGVFANRIPGTFQNQPNPRTWEIRLADGLGYIETRSTDDRPVFVRVWIDEA